MRLDKFLKVSRIIKRRPIAKKVIDNGKVKINEKTAKSGTNVRENDILEIEYFNRYIKAKIITVPTGNVKKDEAADLIELMETKRIETTENIDMDDDF